MKYTSTFEIKGWDVAADGGEDDLADVSRATIRKSFGGELEGTSVGYGVLLKHRSRQAGTSLLNAFRQRPTAAGARLSFSIMAFGMPPAEGRGTAMLFPVLELTDLLA